MLSRGPAVLVQDFTELSCLSDLQTTLLSDNCLTCRQPCFPEGLLYWYRTLENSLVWPAGNHVFQLLEDLLYWYRTLQNSLVCLACRLLSCLSDLQTLLSVWPADYSLVCLACRPPCFPKDLPGTLVRPDQVNGPLKWKSGKYQSRYKIDNSQFNVNTQNLIKIRRTGQKLFPWSYSYGLILTKLFSWMWQLGCIPQCITAVARKWIRLKI